MKTINDAIEYFDGVWPEGADALVCKGDKYCWDNTGGPFSGEFEPVIFSECFDDGYCYLGDSDLGPQISEHCWQALCTREEFEARVAEMDKPWMPEVGQECEINSNLDCSWDRCVALYVGKENVIVSVRGKERHRYTKDDNVKFRPIKTEREKFVEAAMGVFFNGDAWLRDGYGDLYDAGCRFQLKDEES